MKSLNCTSEEAEDGAVAVDMVNQRLSDPASGPAFDMILCDNVMPNLVGVEAVRRIRAMGYDKPIFGVTGCVLYKPLSEPLSKPQSKPLSKPLSRQLSQPLF